MPDLAFIDFEANGFPDEDGTYRACLTYINTLTPFEFNQLFVELDKNFSRIVWTPNTEDVENIEIIFGRIWSMYGENKDWKTNLLQKALTHHAITKKWFILKMKTSAQEKTSTHHYLCYQEDMEYIGEHHTIKSASKSTKNMQHQKVLRKTATTKCTNKTSTTHTRFQPREYTI